MTTAGEIGIGMIGHPIDGSIQYAAIMVYSSGQMASVEQHGRRRSRPATLDRSRCPHHALGEGERPFALQPLVFFDLRSVAG